jgi:predicted transcriptional regulator
VTGLFAGLDIQKALPSIDAFETEKLAALSSLVAGARSAVERNSNGAREIDLIPDTEAPARLAQTLCRLYAGMLAIGLDRAMAWPLVVKTGLDCMPKLRRAVFDVLLATEDWLPTPEIGTRVHHPTVTAKRSLEDMNAHGVVARRRAKKGVGDGKSDMWLLSAAARARMKTIATGMSPPICGDSLSTCSDSPSCINTPSHVEGDITVSMPQTASECGFEAGFGGVSDTPNRHCWSCKEEVLDGDRCPTCEWIVCACGACSPGCGAGGDDIVEGQEP